jgi:beta-galactosidase/beta-glucuronidase
MNDANRGTPVLPAASEQSGNYPRPQLVRSSWASLDGEWDFAFDDDDQGLEGAWYLPGDKSDAAFSSTIRVPFPPESSASTIGDNGFHSVCWYRRAVSARPEGDASARIVLHFGAVDYRAHVWFDGTFLGSHEGGSTPFSFDITRALAGAGGTGTLVVRAEDDPRDVEQPRGKQDWREEPHGIWYHRTTGIWQPVWLEQVPALHVTNLSWIPGSTLNTVRLDLGLNVRPSAPVQVHIALTLRGEELASVHFTQSEPRSSTVITIPRQANGQEYEALLWSPENPRLIDAEVSVRAISGDTDTVASYFGLRTAGWADGHFLLNDRPVYVRAVLAQGYWPNSHLAAPSPSALRDEIQLIKDLGFNTARVHQKIEDPRFLYWADRLGIMLWGENGSAYEFSPTAINRMSREWLDALERDLSHPSIVTWVPLNESWGVQHISHSPEQLDYARALYHLTDNLK